MPIVADTHVHLYPCYRLETALRMLATRLAVLAPGAAPGAILAERAECHFFRDALQAHVPMADSAVETCGPESRRALRVRLGACPPFHLIPGRQVAAVEGIEILALTVDHPFSDGTPAREVILAALEQGAIPVLSWAPGKWLGRREKVVSRLLAEFGPDKLLLGDTTLRPRGWGEPAAMRLAAAEGRAILAGSDPLPFAGEERRLGAYATLAQGTMDDADPVGSVRQALLTARGGRRVGARGQPSEVLYRLIRNQLAAWGRGSSACAPTAWRT